MGALSVTWEPKYREGFQPLLEATHVPFNDIAALDRAVGDSTAAVILEVVQGESGVNVGHHDFLRGAAGFCRDRGALLIVDEIQTGFGRTGRWFAIEHAGIEPDIMCLAKGLGGGFPMGALAYTEAVRGALHQGAHGSTFGGSPLACAAGLAALAVYRDEHLIERSARLGAKMLDDLRRALDGVAIVRDVRGRRTDARDRIAHEGRCGLEGADGRAWRDRPASRSNRPSAAPTPDHQRCRNR